MPLSEAANRSGRRLITTNKGKRETTMALFQPAENTSAYLKMGLMGFAGSGKTKTSALTAIGLVHLMRERGVAAADKPVNFIDTETGSDWVKPDFDQMGVPLQIAKTRAFVDLLTAVRESEKEASTLIVDSVTHFWKELCDSYVARRAAERKLPTYRLQFQDWAYLKGEWAKFTDLFVNSNLHIIVAGRAGFEYDHIEDEDSGKKELQKTGVKMKAEGEMGYEPSLLVFMERHQKLQGSTVAETWREANVLKDRSALLDGKSFVFAGEDAEGRKYPTEQLVEHTFRAFLPHIERLNFGGRHVGVDTARTSEHAIAPDRKDWSSTQRNELVEQIQALLMEQYPGQSQEQKLGKLTLLRKHFGDDELVWATVEERLSLNALMAGYDRMFREIKGRGSKYAAKLGAISGAPAESDAGEPLDALPDHSAAPAATAATKSIEEQLLDQLAEMGSTSDVVHFVGEAGKRTDLDTMARMRVMQAANARISALASQGKPAEATKAEPDPKPSGGKKKPSQGRRTAAAEPDPLESLLDTEAAESVETELRPATVNNAAPASFVDLYA
jgi:hypothetical protein